MLASVPRGPSRLPSARALSSALAAALVVATAVACTSTGTTDAGAPAATVGSSDAASSPTPVTQATFTTPILPPEGAGDIAETVAPGSATELPPVALTDSTALGALTVTLPTLMPVTAEAVGPGEIGGPALGVEIALTNDSDSPIPLDGLSVSLIDASGQVASTTTGEGADPVDGILAPGDTASGVYVFTLAESARSAVTITVSDAATATSVVFTGSAA